MRKYETKSMVGAITDIDPEGRKVKAVWARMGNLDRDSDIIVPGAFSKTISERGPKGSNEIWTLANHDSYMGFKSALGKPSEIYEEGDALVTITDIVDTDFGNDMLKLYMAKCINEHSIGFSLIKSDYQDADQKVRLLKELSLWEGGPQLWGANPDTPTLGITKSWLQEAGNKDSIIEHLSNLTSAVRNGDFTNKTFSLLEIQIKQLQREILEIATQPVVETVEPVQDETLLKAFDKSIERLTKMVMA